MPGWGLVWNGQERRLRALFRLLLQLLVMIALIAGFELALVAVMQATPSGQLVWLAFLGQAAATVISLWLATVLLDRRPMADLGFHFRPAWWLDLAFGLVLGALLMTGIFLVEWAAGWVSVVSTFQSGGSGLPFGLGMAIGGVVFLGVGIYEEMFSRGYQLHNMAEGLCFRPIGAAGAVVLAWVLSSSVFGLLHLGNPHASLVSTANLVVAGLFLGLGYVLTGELAIPIGLHITWNFFQGYIYGFPVSGTGHAASVLAIAQTGPEVWTGGAFGPEAGLIGLVANGAGALLLVAWVRLRQGQVRLHTGLARYPGWPQPGKAEAPAAM